MNRKENEKVLKYKDLKIKIQRVWNMKAEVITVIIGAMEPLQNHSDIT